ncbi:MAG: MerR family transcriptional regulator [Alteromonadaceae bacterium]|uniref:MerR family transcriptional regulator n=1 Tax=unclassified Marinobacter TaxID=83889 RepID=UPI000C6AAFC1|nr:MerR family DNA-binding transcriptional regulator [Marinobacter sp. BGYM27]MAA64029.1 MerR family transcriptional regulator [Alteromonadaceae bacterium]MBH85803.1 MerR family transcriptional regulator [Alteromonadaceae bacterium]MDG5500297.1 MerR family DNA-binding transcriptional regulator [Marinobacter sp. BGYM27]|tara:strand:- start:223 stop:621 length:399 start_codon:yes stop_codon:yes gene_type:complete
MSNLNVRKTYSISDLAKEFDITTRTIRFYEEAGMMTPERDGQTRIYTDQDRVKLKLILRGKRLGFSLAESRDLISMYGSNADNIKQLNALHEKIKQQREALEQQKADIEVMENELDAAEDRCLAAIKELTEA